MLAMLMTDESKAQKIVERAGRGQGGVAWFRLRAEYEPDTAGRQARMLLRIMKTKFASGSDLSEELTGLDLAIDKYETASTDVVTDSMKVGLVQLALAEHFGELQEHLLENASRLSSYSSVVKELMSIVQAREALADDMVVDGGLGKKAGKNGRGKYKGGKDKS